MFVFPSAKVCSPWNTALTTLCDVDDNNCIEEAADYITRNNLVDVIALEFLGSVKGTQPKEWTAEVEVGEYRTIVLPKSLMKGGKLIPTGWPNTSQPFDPDGEPDPGTHWAESKVGDKVTHKVFVDQIENETGLLDELVRQGIIRVWDIPRQLSANLGGEKEVSWSLFASRCRHLYCSYQSLQPASTRSTIFI
jgi:hypothetical protein